MLSPVYSAVLPVLSLFVCRCVFAEKNSCTGHGWVTFWRAHQEWTSRYSWCHKACRSFRILQRTWSSPKDCCILGANSPICRTLLLGYVKTCSEKGENEVLQICLWHSCSCAQVRSETFFLPVVIPTPPFPRLLSMPCCEPLFLFSFSARVPRVVQKDCLESPV